jgi:hypothetical protein
MLEEMIELIKGNIRNPIVRCFLYRHDRHTMEAVAFYEKEVGTDCSFYKAGIKQMAMGFIGGGSQIGDEAMRVLRQADKTKNTPTDMH